MAKKTNTPAASKGRTFQLILWVLLCLILLFAGFLAYRTFFCPLPEGMKLGSVDLSGLSAFEARKVMEEALDASLYSQSLSVELPEETLTLTPTDTGVKLDLSQALRDALHAQAPRELLLADYLTVAEAQIRNLLETYAASYDTTLVQPVWSLEGPEPALGTQNYDATVPCQTLMVTMGIPELHLDVDTVYSQILEALSDAVALCQGNRFCIAPEVLPEKLPQIPDVDILYTQFAREPVNDSLNMETYGFVPGAYGLTFDREGTEKAIASAAYGETLSVPLDYVQPEIMGEDTYYQDVLGYCETKHTDNENRNTNLKLLCQALDGFILQPGEEFSFNGVVGERTKEKGYMPAPAYSGDRLVDAVGGGVCQGSTTLYNCVLLADLEVVNRVCHGATVGYVKLGLDATVNWGTTDFQFRNNFNFPVKIQAEVSDGYMKMKILGTDEKDYYVKMEATQGDDEVAIYARSYKCKYDKETDELISRETEAFSTYYKNIG